MRTLRLELGHLPPSKLSMNAHIYWRTKNKEMQGAKDEIVYLIKNFKWQGEPMERARLSYEFHLKDKRVRDYDNLISMCKGYPDGLKAAGVILKDDIWHLELGRVYAVLDSVVNTVIILEELPSGRLL